MYECKYLLLTFLLVSQANSKLEMKGEQNGNGVYLRCGGKSLKISNICAYVAEDTIEGGKASNDKFFYIFSNCKDYEQCEAVGENGDNSIYKCIPQIVKREHGESCVYNSDCYSSNCKGEKCEALSDGTECRQDYQCKPDSHCGRHEDGKYKCKKMLKEKSTCTIYDDKDKCRLGLSCYEEQCIKWGSLKTGTVLKRNQFDDDIYNPLCESGMAARVKNNQGENEWQCVEVETEGQCEQIEGAESSTSFKGLNNALESKCEGYHSVDGKKIFVTPYMKFTNTAFKDFMEDYNSIKAYEDDFYKGDKYQADWQGFGNHKAKLKFLKYFFGNELIGRKMIDDKGKVINSCEFEFFLKKLSSGFAKFNILISILLLFGLLF